MRIAQALGCVGLAMVLCAQQAGAKDGFPASLPFHVVVLDRRGEMHGTVDMLDENRPCKDDCVVDYAPKTSDVDAYVAAQIAHLRKYVAAGSAPHVVLYVHGGLNTGDDGLRRAKEFYANALDAKLYPIFVNWDSSFQTSYVDHVFRVRQGRYRDGGLLGPLVSPAYVAGDLARIAGHAIPAIAQLVQNDFEGSIACPGHAWCQEDPHAVVDHLRCEKDRASACPIPPTCPIPLSDVTIDKDLDREAVSGFLSWLVTYPFQLLLTPIIDGLGTPSWDVMLRRTTNAFHRDADFAFDADGVPMTKGRTGGLARFLDALSAEVAGKEGWQITIIGHSMGTIIGNAIIREYGTHPTDVVVGDVTYARPPLPITNVVYMGAACTIRDYQDSVWPLLRAGNGKRPQIYHLMLHPKAESQEWEGWYPIPRGSLLVWLDGFFTNPSTPLDLMAGRFTNLMRTIAEVPSAFQSSIHYTVFEKSKPGQPQTHGSFGNVSFWDRSCWDGTSNPAAWEKNGCFK